MESTPPDEPKPSTSSPRKNSISVPSNAENLKSLREILLGSEVDAFIVGSGDAHQSEYVSDSEARRQFISGFTGSAGTALITNDRALLWTDSRYFLQASKELSSDWTLMRQGEPGVPEIDDWLIQNLSRERVVGVDASLMTNAAAKATETKMKGAGIRLQGMPENPVDKVWGSLRPAVPSAKITAHPMTYAGVSHAEKLAKIRTDTLVETGADGIVFSMLDEVAWLHNIRGADVSYNPVVYSFAYVTQDTDILFIDPTKIGEDVSMDGVDLKAYEEIEEFLSAQAAQGKTVLADSTQLNWKLVSALGVNHKEITSPITLAKSIKNDAELKGVADAHIRDGVALTAFLGWLEQEVTISGNEVTEFKATEVLESYRRKMEKNVGLSFTTIAGYGANGAIIHYRPAEEGSAVIGTDSLLLLDSGGQYLDGTTDTTRTVHFGEPDEKMKRCYSLVLKGQIALSRVVFPEGTLGSRLDTLARMSLWSQGLDFKHGTGHGVGAFLNVHEGPQGISFRQRANETGFYKGMTTSNEPGYYEEGNFGIRIEDVCITIDAKTPNKFGNKDYCTFQCVTMVPKSTKLVDLDLIDDSELAYLNEYNSTVRNTLLKDMETLFPEAVPYLMRETEPLRRK